MSCNNKEEIEKMSSKWMAWARHELWTLQLGPLYHPEESSKQ